MLTRPETLTPLIRAMAALLLLCHGGVAATAGIVHAGERLSAPLAIEAHHGGGCVVLHDPARCPGCQVGGAPPPPRDRSVAHDGTPRRASALATGARPARCLNRATPPRAPPVFSV